MYQQIARNKRWSAVYIVVFFLVWVGVGAVVGLIVAATAPRPRRPPPAGPPDVLVGMVIAGCWRWPASRSRCPRVRAWCCRCPAPIRRIPTSTRSSTTSSRRWLIGDGHPKPAVYVIDDPSPERVRDRHQPEPCRDHRDDRPAGRSMNREELEGVIGHEMSHIKNYDVRLILIVSTLIGMAGLLASLVWRSAFFMRPRGRDSDQS